MIDKGFKCTDINKCIAAIVCLLVLFTSCKNQNSKATTEKAIDSIPLTQKIDKKSNTLFKFNNVVFSIPSPYEFAYFVKNLGITYNKEYVNPAKNATSYSSSFKKAVNLGVYGTDLGYLTINEQTPDAVSYFATIKNLSNDIGIASVFGKKTMDRIEKNMNNKDSLMYILSNSY